MKPNKDSKNPQTFNLQDGDGMMNLKKQFEDKESSNETSQINKEDGGTPKPATISEANQILTGDLPYVQKLYKIQDLENKTEEEKHFDYVRNFGKKNELTDKEIEKDIKEIKENMPKKTAEKLGLTNEKENSSLNPETIEAKEKKWNNFFKLQEIKLKIREGFLSTAKKAIYDKLNKAGNFVGEKWDTAKNSEFIKKAGKGLSSYSEFMNGGKIIYQTKMGIDAEGQPIYYKYTYRKLALSAAIAGTAVAFLPVTGLASATVFGTKIARGAIGGLTGAFANKGVNNLNHRYLGNLAERKRELEENPTENAEKIKSIEKEMRIVKLAYKGASIIIGIGAGYAASTGFSSAASLIDKNIPDLPKFNLGNINTDNEAKLTNTGHNFRGGDYLWDNRDGLKTDEALEQNQTDIEAETVPEQKIESENTTTQAEVEKPEIEIGSDNPNAPNPEKNILTGEQPKTEILEQKTEPVEKNATVKAETEGTIQQTDPIVEEKNVPENSNSSIPKEAMIDSKNNVGITYAFKSQLESNPELAEKLGYNQAENKALFLKELGKKLGYIGENEDVRIKADTNVAYVLKVDETGNPSVEEYQNGKIVETHKTGDIFEDSKNQESYEETKSTENEKYSIEGEQSDPEGMKLEDLKKDPNGENLQDSKYEIDGAQVDPEGTEKLQDLKKDATTTRLEDSKHEIKGGQVNPDLTSVKTGTVNENIVKNPEEFSIEKTVWADPKHIDVKYYLNFEKAINDTSIKNTLNKDILDALIKNGTVIDNKTTDIFGNVRHEYHFQGEEVVQRTQEHAEYMNKVSGRNIINTNPRVGETMQQYVDRLEHNMKTFAENSKTSNSPEEYQKGRSDGFHDAVQERKLYGHRNELARFGSRLLANALRGPENGTYWGVQGPQRIYNPRPNY